LIESCSFMFLIWFICFLVFCVFFFQINKATLLWVALLYLTNKLQALPRAMQIKTAY